MPTTAPSGRSAIAACLQRDEGVAHVLARQVAVEQQAAGLLHRHVLHRMHRDVDAARQQLLLDLLGEQPLVADLLQRPVGGDQGGVVAGGLDHHDLEGVLGQVEGGHQPGAGLVRLGERQRRAAGADLQGRGGGGQDERHGPGFKRGKSACPRPFARPRRLTSGALQLGNQPGQAKGPTMTKLLLRALAGETLDVPPIWMMRQAGATCRNTAPPGPRRATS